MKKGNKIAMVLLLAAVVVMGLAGLGNIFSPTTNRPAPTSADTSANDSQPAVQTNVPCSDPSQPVLEQYHIHPHLQIIIEGNPVTIPAGIGLPFFGCDRVIHTHDNTGTIHIEPNQKQDFTLGDFFSVWAQPFSKDRIMDYKADAAHEITMTVDGKPNTEYENLVLKDLQQIVIEYKAIK